MNSHRTRSATAELVPDARRAERWAGMPACQAVLGDQAETEWRRLVADIDSVSDEDLKRLNNRLLGALEQMLERSICARLSRIPREDHPAFLADRETLSRRHNAVSNEIAGRVNDRVLGRAYEIRAGDEERTSGPAAVCPTRTRNTLQDPVADRARRHEAPAS